MITTFQSSLKAILQSDPMIKYTIWPFLLSVKDAETASQVRKRLKTIITALSIYLDMRHFQKKKKASE